MATPERKSRGPGPARRTDLAAASGTVAVSGPSTFLGRNLVAVLEDDPGVRAVVALDLRAPASAGPKTRFCEVDLTHAAPARVAEALRGVDVLVHLAFTSSPAPSSVVAHDLESASTRHLLAAARQAGVRKVVMGSQTLLYGAEPSNPNFLTERHPLRASREEPWFAEKIDAEEELARFAKAAPEVAVTVLRTAPILGPTVHNFVTRYLARRFVPTALGFDPMVQFLHEVDAIDAFRRAIGSERSGVFNVVGRGVMRLSAVLDLAERVAVPIPHPLARRAMAALWLVQLAPVPPSFMGFLRHVCVADGAQARSVLGFEPAYSTHDAVVDYLSARRLREVKLLKEAG